MLEVCVDSFESVQAAVEGGAHRIELCSALSEGGLTATPGLLKAFPATKVFAMLRSHGRISYQHTYIDMEIIEKDIVELIENGVDGFVFGALTADRNIDVDKCRQVVDSASGLPVTFHRAFDMTIPSLKFQNVDKIAECGFRRILSSGFAETAELGIEALTQIKKYIAEKHYNLILMPGCGVSTRNVDSILQTTGCKEFHASAKIKRTERITAHVSDTSAISKDIRNNAYAVTDRTSVQQLVTIGKKYI
ncbi:copper homeostasis protein cutC homolog isoform X2 [Sitodiplosis mosellana]|uniref:copper homeostasis protein cutC homolog isoform X2 n=1 Tax=Sitodiplosis mosellana TaxID=263140 RepID=UPI0024446AA0|nr:copper homeostasis protein cutC homolog isoform X2 [Sitodiplosis mosellana]